MEEMISRARRRTCDHVTVSGGVGAPAFYRRFGFGPALNLELMDCDLPDAARAGSCEQYVPADFEHPPSTTLWVGRFLSPTQKWREIVDGTKRRDAILPEWAQRPRPVGIASERLGFLGFLVPHWGSPAKADLYCWSQTVTRETVSALLAQARSAGYGQAGLLCHPDVAGLVSSVDGCAPSGSWPIWAKRL
jgi:hypothetical protein